MAINELIARGVAPIQFENPLNQLSKVMQMTQAQQGIKKNNIEFEQYQKGVDRTNSVNALMQSLDPNSTAEQRIAALQAKNFYPEADAIMTGELKRRETTSKADHQDMETTLKHVGQWRDALGSAINPQQAAQFIQLMHSDPRLAKTPIGQVPLDQALAQIGTTPESFAEWKKNSALGATKFIELNKPTYQTVDRGDTKDTLALPGLGGPVTVANTATVQQSPDNAATQATSLANNAANNERMAKEGAASRGNAMAIAKMADARSRDANTIARDTKPLTEGQSKSALFGSRMAMANQIFDTLEQSGTTTSTPGMNSGYGIGSVVNALSGKDQQQLMQAKRDFLNAVLRRESGAVIGESEFAGGEKQYFPQVGDTKEVIAQKKANREAAMRGVLIDVPSNKRDEIVSEITGQGASKGGATKGKFKYLGTE